MLIKKENKRKDNQIMKLLIKSLVRTLPKDKVLKQRSHPSYLNSVLNAMIRLNNFYMVKYLVENEIFISRNDINIKDCNNEYSLFVAFVNENIKIFKYLLDHGANWNIKNINGLSLLSLILSKHKYKYLQYLLKHNININEKNNSGNYPLITAINEIDFDSVMAIDEHSLEYNFDMNITEKIPSLSSSQIKSQLPLSLSKQQPQPQPQPQPQQIKKIKLYKT